MALQAGLSLDKNIQQLYDKIYADDYEKLCPIYRQAVAELTAKLNSLITEEKKLQILTNFGEKYLLLPTYIRQKLTLEKNINSRNRFLGSITANPENSQESAKQTHQKHLYTIYYYNILPPIKIWTERQILASTNCNDKHIAWKINLEESCETVYKVETVMKSLERALTFPHRYLQKIFNLYKIVGTKPITKKLESKIQKFIILFENFKEAEIDDDKWFNCMSELDEDDVIIANIEYRLGFEMKCSNKEIWKYYIKFMRKKDTKEMLDIYRRYCRLFISDNQMKEEYRSEIEKNGNLSEFWYDTIKFEMDFGSLELAKKFFKKWMDTVNGESEDTVDAQSREEFLQKLENYKTQMEKAAEIDQKTITPQIQLNRKRKTINPEKIVPPKMGCSNDEFMRYMFALKGKEYKTLKELHPKLPKYYQSNFELQNFSFKNPLIYYITQKSIPKVLQKLYFSCKYFYHQLKKSICHRLIIDPNTAISSYSRFFQHSYILSAQDLVLEEIKNLHITNSLICGNEMHNSGDQKILSKVISHLYKCDAKYLKIFKQDLTIVKNMTE